MARYIIDGKLLVIEALKRKMEAQGTRVSKSTLSRIFSGQRKPSYDLAKAMARALDVGLDDLDLLLSRTARLAAEEKRMKRMV